MKKIVVLIVMVGATVFGTATTANATETAESYRKPVVVKVTTFKRWHWTLRSAPVPVTPLPHR